jgi:predicted  nucleic acid-binding Zn-ribbon protein
MSDANYPRILALLQDIHQEVAGFRLRLERLEESAEKLEATLDVQLDGVNDNVIEIKNDLTVLASTLNDKFALGISVDGD